MKRILLIASIVLFCNMLRWQETQKVNISIKSGAPSGIIDQKLYGQLFEHIYFSADGGLWGEMFAQRSFEPEQYPGISPRDGFFDGWYADDEKILHFPHPLRTTYPDDYHRNTDIKWRGYKLSRHMWSGGYADMRIEFKNISEDFRLHDPQHEPANPRNQEPAIKVATLLLKGKLKLNGRGATGRQYFIRSAFISRSTYSNKRILNVLFHY